MGRKPNQARYYLMAFAYTANPHPRDIRYSIYRYKDDRFEIAKTIAGVVRWYGSSYDSFEHRLRDALNYEYLKTYEDITGQELIEHLDGAPGATNINTRRDWKERILSG